MSKPSEAGSDQAPERSTLCARPGELPRSVTRPLAHPIQPSSVYRVDSLDQIDALYSGQESGYFYARDGHPNAEHLAATLARLEGATVGLICASGMAAEASLFLHALAPGATIALSDGLYGKSVRLVEDHLGRWGVKARTFDPTQRETLAEVLATSDDCRVVFVETISNPLVRVADLEGLAAAISASRSNAALVVDNTFAPYICRPMEWGATAVTHSLTKLIGGHSDVTLGFLGGSEATVSGARACLSAFGMNGSPFDCWLAHRGLATLPVRSDRACATANELASRLATSPAVQAVNYPGRPDHPDHARAGRLLSGGYGAMMSIDLTTRARADQFIRRLEGQIPFAPSLGDVATTLSHPATTSHRGQSPEQWARQGITPGLIRLSIGLEDVRDLWHELSGALQALDA
jgi:cystathionine beta-lyase/cystathionine gamma-synthase